VLRKVISVVQGQCHLLESDDRITVKKTEINELCSDQEETDTRIVLYCAYAPEQGYRTVRIRSSVSDVFSSCYVTHQSFTLPLELYHWYEEQEKAPKYLWVGKVVWPKHMHSPDVSSCIHRLRHHHCIYGCWESSTHQIAPEDRSFPKCIDQTRRYMKSYYQVGWGNRAVLMWHVWDRMVQKCGCSSCSNPEGETMWPRWKHQLWSKYRPQSTSTTRKHCFNISGVPTSRLVGGKLLIYLAQEYYRPPIDSYGQLLTSNSNPCGSKGHWTFIVGVSHDFKRYFTEWTYLEYFMFVSNGLTSFDVWILQFIYYFSSTGKCVRSWYIAIHVWYYCGLI